MLRCDSPSCRVTLDDAGEKACSILATLPSRHTGVVRSLGTGDGIHRGLKPSLPTLPTGCYGVFPLSLPPSLSLV